MDRPTTRAENVLLEADLWARSTSKCDLHSYHNFLNSSLFIKHLSTMKSAVIAALIGSAAAFAPAPVAKTTSVSYVLRLL